MVVVAVVCLAACSSGDQDDADVAETTSTAAPTMEAVATTGPVAPTTVPDTTEPPSTTAPTTTEPPSTTAAPATTDAPTTTAAPQPHRALVWESVVDPARANQPAHTQPTETHLSVTARLQVVGLVDARATGTAAHDCRENYDFYDEVDGRRAPGEQCLLLQWEFDVAEDAPGDSFLRLNSVLNSDGTQQDMLDEEHGLPGSRDRVLVSLVPGGQAGAQAHMLVGDGENFEEWGYTIPPAEALLPVELG